MKRKQQGTALIVALVALLTLSALSVATLSTVSTGHYTMAEEVLQLEAKYVALAGLEYAWNGICATNFPDAGVRFGNGQFYIFRRDGRLISRSRVLDSVRVYSINDPHSGKGFVLGTCTGHIEFWMPDLLIEAPTWVKRTTMYQASGPITALKLSDLDLDGDTDIVVGTANGLVEVWVNQGDCKAVRPADPYDVAGPVTSLDVADVTGEGVADVLVGTSTVGSELQLWVGSIAAVDHPLLIPHAQGAFDARQPVHAVRIGAVNGDANPDAVYDGLLAVALNNGAGGFSYGYNSPLRVDGSWLLRDLALDDFNLDGKLDVVVASSNRSFTALKNDGTRFAPFRHSKYVTRGDARAIVSARMNGDSRPDVVLATRATEGARLPEAGRKCLKCSTVHENCCDHRCDHGHAGHCGVDCGHSHRCCEAAGEGVGTCRKCAGSHAEHCVHACAHGHEGHCGSHCGHPHHCCKTNPRGAGDCRKCGTHHFRYCVHACDHTHGGHCGSGCGHHHACCIVDADACPANCCRACDSGSHGTCSRRGCRCYHAEPSLAVVEVWLNAPCCAGPHDHVDHEIPGDDDHTDRGHGNNEDHDDADNPGAGGGDHGAVDSPTDVDSPDDEKKKGGGGGGKTKGKPDRDGTADDGTPSGAGGEHEDWSDTHSHQKGRGHDLHRGWGHHQDHDCGATRGLCHKCHGFHDAHCGHACEHAHAGHCGTDCGHLHACCAREHDCKKDPGRCRSCSQVHAGHCRHVCGHAHWGHCGSHCGHQHACCERTRCRHACDHAHAEHCGSTCGHPHDCPRWHQPCENPNEPCFVQSPCTPLPLGHNALSVAAWDVDFDSLPDVLVGTEGNRFYAFRGVPCSVETEDAWRNHLAGACRQCGGEHEGFCAHTCEHSHTGHCGSACGHAHLCCSGPREGAVDDCGKCHGRHRGHCKHACEHAHAGHCGSHCGHQHADCCGIEGFAEMHPCTKCGLQHLGGCGHACDHLHAGHCGSTCGHNHACCVMPQGETCTHRCEHAHAGHCGSHCGHQHSCGSCGHRCDHKHDAHCDAKCGHAHHCGSCAHQCDHMHPGHCDTSCGHAHSCGICVPGCTHGCDHSHKGHCDFVCGHAHRCGPPAVVCEHRCSHAHAGHCGTSCGHEHKCGTCRHRCDHAHPGHCDLRCGHRHACILDVPCGCIEPAPGSPFATTCDVTAIGTGYVQ